MLVCQPEELRSGEKGQTSSATTDSPGLARDLVRSELAHCDEETVAAAELMISELVTNAVVHGSGPIEAELRRETGTVWAAVTDGSPKIPVPTVSQHVDRRGRGLLIVRALAGDWGVVEYEAGKSVWFTVPCRQARRPSPDG